ncbi:MAG: chorismate-binding protein, partial [Planctomycetota bacterium]
MPPPRPTTECRIREVRLPAPLEAFRRLGRRKHAFFRLAAAAGFRGTPWSLLAVDPSDVLRVVRVSGRRRLSDLLAPLRPRPVVRRGPTVPFAGGWAGMIGYEGRSAVEDRPPPRRAPLGTPAIWLGRYEAVLAWNHRNGKSYVAGLGESGAAAGRRLLAATRGRQDARRRSAVAVHPPRARASPAAYRETVAAARRAVRAGEIFQANVSQRFDARFEGPACALFERLVEEHPAPYMTFLALGAGRAVLSASPERFVRVAGRVVETDPMKGTRPRGDGPAEDRRLRHELETSE